MASRLLLSLTIVAAAAFAANAASAATIGGAAATTAGCTGKAKLDNALSADDPSWPSPDDVFSIGDGKIQLTAEADKGAWVQYGGALFDDADICVDISVSGVTDPSGSYGGLLFWFVDADNYYGFHYDPAGDASILRMQNGKLLWPVRWRKVPTLKTGSDAVNSLRVTLKGNSITSYINGQQFFKVNGDQPKGGGQFGFDGFSEKANPNPWTFTNLKITDVPAK
jgi:hypothetical protein